MIASRLRPTAGPAPPCPDGDGRPGAQRLRRIKQALSDIADAEMSYARRRHLIAARRHSHVDWAMRKAVREVREAFAGSGRGAGVGEEGPGEGGPGEEMPGGPPEDVAPPPGK